MSNEDQQKLNQLRSENLDLGCFIEGLEEHIGDLLEAIKPFTGLFIGSSGNIPTERLSFADWHKLARVYNAASAAMRINTMATKYEKIDQLLHDAEHAESGPTFAGTMGDNQSCKELRTKRDDLLAKAQELDPAHKAPAWAEHSKWLVNG